MAVTNVLILICVFITTAAGTPCHEGWHLFQESCYGFSDSVLSFGSAQEVCRTYGATLAEVTSEAEHVFLKDLVTNKNFPSVWLGGTDMFEEGTWEWIGSQEKIIGFNKWRPGAPDDYLQRQDCLTMFKPSQYLWDDIECSATLSFVCEARPETVVG